MTNDDQQPGTGRSTRHVLGTPSTPHGYWYTGWSNQYSVFLLRTDTGIRVGSAKTQENASCASSVAGVGLQDLANRANRTDVRITNQNMIITAGNYIGTFCTRDFTTTNFSTRLPFR